MKKIIDYFVDNSAIVNLLTLLIVVMGALSMFSLNKETFPNVDFNYIIIRTVYPGAAAEDVEKLVTIGIERELQEVEGVEELNAMSAESGSIISIKVDPNYDVDEVLVEVKDAVDKVSDMPLDVEDPIITRINNRTRGLMKVGIYGDGEWDLRSKAKAIRDRMERESYISKIQLTGYRDEVFYIEADLEKLKLLEMSLTELIASISDRNLSVSAGTLKLPDKEKMVRVIKENETVRDIENIVVRATDLGETIKVKDVAKVSRTLKDAQREDRSNGELAIFLDVAIKESADVLDSAQAIKNQLLELSQELDFKYEIMDDLSVYVERRLGVLSQNGIQGILLVFVCLLFFLNAKVSLITALGAPFAFFFAFSLMDVMGITINLISMFGLILVLGMLVDDSIIVAEQYYQKLEEGLKPKEAAKKAALETVAPVTATILTTMVAFGSLFFIDGIMGKFLWPVPAVVILALLASWLECFFILPGHLNDFAGKDKNVEKTKWYQPLLKLYEATLRKVLVWPKLTILFFFCLFALSVFTISKMRFELFPSDDITRAQIHIKGEVGTPFEVTRSELLNMEQALLASVKKDELLGYQTITGYQDFSGGRSKTGSHYGSLAFELTMAADRERGVNAIFADVAKEAKKRLSSKFQFSLEKDKQGPPSGRPINIELYGDELSVLEKLAYEIRKDLSGFEGVQSAEVDYEKGKKQIIVDIDEVEARRLGLSNTQIAQEIRTAIEGAEVASIKKSDEDIDVIVRLKERQRQTEASLSEIEIQNRQGRTIRLEKIASFREQEGAYLIRRLDRKRVISISGEVDLQKTTSVEVNRKIDPYLREKLAAYPGIDFALTGENKDTQDSLESFKKAVIASTFIIFIIIFIQFKSLVLPIVVMSALPFGLIGVVTAFAVFQLPIGFMALMGMLGLVGVVINDSIVLTTFVEREVQEKGYVLDSIIKGCVSRFRPVILTTFTTVAGLLPVAHMPGGDPFLKPMAVSFAYGLLFASLITLLLVPAMFKFTLDLRVRFSRVRT